MGATQTQTSPFRLAVFFIFFLFAGVGVIMFALFQATGGTEDIGDVSMWGTIPEEQFGVFLNDLSFIDPRAANIRYRYIFDEDFDASLIEALASGRGPDIVLITNDQITHHRDRIFATPYEQYGVREFRDTYIESAESLLLPEGIIGLPVAIDPLVLYWNRTLLANNQYTLPPKKWGELFKMSQKITKRSEAGNIELATIALGEFTNIRHAKDIFIAMLMQAGGSVVTEDDTGKQISALTKKSSKGTSPAQDALRFYTSFADPAKNTYTWSKAQPQARDAFIAGDLAMYVGYASELTLILAQNPNLNFDVAQLPQLPGAAQARKSTIARVFALAIPKVARNPQGAGQLLNALTAKDASILLEKNLGLPSPRRDLLAIEPTDPLKTTFRNSAIMAQSWRDPDPQATYNIIRKMVESVLMGNERMSQAVNRAQREMHVLLGSDN